MKLFHDHVYKNLPFGPYLERDQNSLRPLPYFLKVNFTISFHTLQGLPNSLFPSGISTKSLYATLLSKYVLCVPSILLFLITRIWLERSRER